MAATLQTICCLTTYTAKLGCFFEEFRVQWPTQSVRGALFKRPNPNDLFSRICKAHNEVVAFRVRSHWWVITQTVKVSWRISVLQDKECTRELVAIEAQVLQKSSTSAKLPPYLAHPSSVKRLLWTITHKSEHFVPGGEGDAMERILSLHLAHMQVTYLLTSCLLSNLSQVRKFLINCGWSGDEVFILDL